MPCLRDVSPFRMGIIMPVLQQKFNNLDVSAVDDCW